MDGRLRRLVSCDSLSAVAQQTAIAKLIRDAAPLSCEIRSLRARRSQNPTSCCSGTLQHSRAPFYTVALLESFEFTSLKSVFFELCVRKVCVEIAEQLEYRLFQLYNEPRLRDDFHELLAPQSPVRASRRTVTPGDQQEGGTQAFTRTLFRLCLLSALLERLGQSPPSGNTLRGYFGPLDIRVCNQERYT